MSSIEKIRQEIERRKKICEDIFERESDIYYQGKAVAYGELLAFIDSLPDEDENHGCGVEFPHFGANYPDAKCIDGYLWDMDSYEDGVYTIGGDDPCPICNTEKWMKDVLDDEIFKTRDEALEYVKMLKSKYKHKDSLPEEIPPYITGFKGDPDPPGISDLEQAAARYERDNRQSVLSSVDIVNAFIEGAKWQANQLLKGSPLPEDTVIFQKGVAEGRRLEREEVPRWKKGPAVSEIRTRDYWPVSDAPILGKPETRDYLIVKRGESMALAFHAEEGDYYLSTEELDKIPTE